MKLKCIFLVICMVLVCSCGQDLALNGRVPQSQHRLYDATISIEEMPILPREQVESAEYHDVDVSTFKYLLFADKYIKLNNKTERNQPLKLKGSMYIPVLPDEDNSFQIGLKSQGYLSGLLFGMGKTEISLFNYRVPEESMKSMAFDPYTHAAHDFFASCVGVQISAKNFCRYRVIVKIERVK